LTALALLACAFGPGCSAARGPKSSTLPAAGSSRDRETGVLARLSVGAGGPAGAAGHASGRPAGRADGAGRADDHATRRADDAGRAADHATRRAARASGASSAPSSSSPYANYRFDRSPRPHAAPLPYGERYVPVVPTAVGAIEGTVLWPHSPGAAERVGALAPGAASARGCPATDTRPLVGAGGGVAGAVVYLEDITSGRLLLGRLNSSYPNPTRHMQLGGVLEWRGCRFHPSVQVVAPIGSVLGLVTVDEAIQISATRVDGPSRAPVWSVALGAPGAVHERLLGQAGMLEIRAERPGVAASAWVVVAPHPYYVLTDERGHFTLDEVPPGTYTLVVWHAPVVVGFTPTGTPITRSLVPIRRRVVVSARQAARVVLRLPPAH